MVYLSASLLSLYILFNSFTIFLLPLFDLLLLICLGSSLWQLNGKILKAIDPAILLHPILECHHLCIVKYICTLNMQFVRCDLQSVRSSWFGTTDESRWRFTSSQTWIQKCSKQTHVSYGWWWVRSALAKVSLSLSKLDIFSIV